MRYEDYMEGLNTVLNGITISQLSIALHQLETKGLLHPDPHGTPNRRIRVTPGGKALIESKNPPPEAAPAPAPAPASAPAPEPAVVVEASAPVPVPPVASSPASAPAPTAPASGGSVESAQDIRRRLREVITREESIRSAEERMRQKESELLNEEERLTGIEKSLDERRLKLDEDAKQIAIMEDSLHEQLVSLKSHLQSMAGAFKGVNEIHERVSSSKQKRQKSS